MDVKSIEERIGILEAQVHLFELKLNKLERLSTDKTGEYYRESMEDKDAVT